MPARGNPERAARLVGASDALFALSNVPLDPADRAAYERTVGAARAGLGAPAYAAARTAGQAMTLEQAVTDALGGASEASSSCCIQPSPGGFSGVRGC